ncbi:hypothetical protein D3C85_1640030 [compost metagenome]
MLNELEIINERVLLPGYVSLLLVGCVIRYRFVEAVVPNAFTATPAEAKVVATGTVTYMFPPATPSFCVFKPVASTSHALVKVPVT